MKNYFAVITGDLIASSKKERSSLLEELKVVLERITLPETRLALPPFELYRGDSFQGILSHPEEALKDALIIRTCLKKSNKNPDSDARLAIGIGTIDFPSTTIAESDGEAFRNSGPILDEMKNGIKIKVKSPWKEINDELEVALILADAIISRWSPSQAEVIVQNLEGTKQTEIASALGISQSAVNQRLKAANWEAIEKLIERYRYLIAKSIQQK